MKDPSLVVILAEDNRGHSELLKRNLFRGGLKCKVEQFSNGRELFEYLESELFFGSEANHVLLLDLGLPGIDGVEVLRRIKSDAGLRSMPVIVFSSSDDYEDVVMCYSLGCNSYITKPIDYEKFVGTVRSVGAMISQIEFPQMQLVHG